MVSFYTVSVFSCFFFRGLNQYTTGSWRTKTLQIPLEREQYLDAKKHYNSSDPQSREELKKLLMRRAMVSIPLVISLQNEGNAIERLYKKGMLTDDMHFRVKELKAFVEQEFHDVQQEAEEFLEGWSAHIWPQAMQFHTLIKKHASVDIGDNDKDEQSNYGEDEPQNNVAKESDPKVKTDFTSSHKFKDKTPEEVAEIMAAQLLKEEETATKKVRKKAALLSRDRKVTPVTLD